MGRVAGSSPTIESLATSFRDSELAMPEIQRGEVWTPRQIAELLDSLYRGFPIGTMLFWRPTEQVETREHSVDPANATRFVLDGQQRLTALAGVRFDGEPKILFNAEEEEFTVATAATVVNPLLIPVSEILQSGATEVADERGILDREDRKTLLKRLTQVEKIKDISVTVHTVEDFTYAEVAEIFIRANTTGRPLGSADIAIARIALRLPGMVSGQLQEFRQSLEGGGWNIEVPLIIRCLVAVATGRSELAAIRDLSASDLDSAWRKTALAIEDFLNHLRNDLGVDSWDYVTAGNALVVPVACVAHYGSENVDKRKLLRWFLLSLTWQRYSAGAEGRMNQDLQDLKVEQPFEALEDRLRHTTGRQLEVLPTDLDRGGRGGRSRFLLTAYLAFRGRGATDWFKDVTLTSTNLGRANKLEEHHIFPQATLKGRHEQSQIDELANIALLSQKANRKIRETPPAEYLPTVDSERLRQQLVPTDPALWELDRFHDFLAFRRESLADAINDVLADPVRAASS